MNTAAITIRDAVPEDAGRLLEIYDYYVKNTAITFDYETPSLADFLSRMAATQRRYPYLVILSDGRVEGYAYAGPFKARAAYDRSVETTIYLAPDAQKRGLGRALYEALDRDYANMTRIIIAQRIASVRGADRIAVLDGGTIVACGSHEQLLAESAVYRDICASQLRGEEGQA